MEVVKALKEQGYDSVVIDDATRMLDPNITVSQYQSLTANRHLVKSIGFSSFKATRACLDSAKKEPDQNKMRKAIIPISVKYIMANLKVNDQFLLDEPRKSFVTLVQNYVTPTNGERNGKTDNTVIGAIRHNCLLSANLFLESNKNPNTVPLHALAKYDIDQCETRSIPFRDLDKVIKTCQSSKCEQDILKNEVAIPIAFNCFLCTSACNEAGSDSNTFPISKEFAQSQAEHTQSTPLFVDGSMAHFNALKARVCMIFSRVQATL